MAFTAYEQILSLGIQTIQKPILNKGKLATFEKNRYLSLQ